ncbi:(Na+)-NQR maturation NqrM [Aliidiomarina quisquiliarum]|uniref:(Na+)-NQR maturation NqrM n=1 Tax=Aliidiomarina quisquiliarum TaxID=2938947 RepID=UPI00208F9EA3|nr:(Na+)-NQR maturation NqrM [Aliidiomarina quisquiliarum]MCO4320331.1 (Na+)-NQR maturation NqrM [Aliidiomarina quisquiliarum]
MQTFILAFVLMLIVFAGMSLGFLVQRKSIAGSCGGIGALGMEKACDCADPCEARKERERTRATREKSWQENRIV